MVRYGENDPIPPDEFRAFVTGVLLGRDVTVEGGVVEARPAGDDPFTSPGREVDAEAGDYVFRIGSTREGLSPVTAVIRRADATGGSLRDIARSLGLAADGMAAKERMLDDGFTADDANDAFRSATVLRDELGRRTGDGDIPDGTIREIGVAVRRRGSLRFEDGRDSGESIAISLCVSRVIDGRRHTSGELFLSRSILGDPEALDALAASVVEESNRLMLDESSRLN
jgi:hypothetical protein